MNTLNPFGLNIESQIPLPGVSTPSDPVDVTILFGPVPDTLDDAVMVRICAQIAPGRYLLNVHAVAKYLVENGQKITIEPYPGVSNEEIRLFLLGPIWGALLFQRGLLPIHGSAIRVGEGTAIFSGSSGNGKSVLAAAFHDRGYAVAADELCAVDIPQNGVPMLLPGFPHILLWADALRKMGKDSHNLTRIRADLEKFILPLEGNTVREPLPLKRLYLLNTCNTPNFTLSPLHGLKKNHAVIDCTYRAEQVSGFGLRVSHFRQCATAAMHMDVKRLERPTVPFDLENLVHLLEEDFHG